MGKKNNQTSVSDADRDIPILRSMDNTGNSVNLIYGIIHLPSGLDFSVCIETNDRFYFSISSRVSYCQVLLVKI